MEYFLKHAETSKVRKPFPENSNLWSLVHLFEYASEADDRDDLIRKQQNDRKNKLRNAFSGLKLDAQNAVWWHHLTRLLDNETITKDQFDKLLPNALLNNSEADFKNIEA